jgi:hypothetical protein
MSICESCEVREKLRVEQAARIASLERDLSDLKAREAAALDRENAARADRQEWFDRWIRSEAELSTARVRLGEAERLLGAAVAALEAIPHDAWAAAPPEWRRMQGDALIAVYRARRRDETASEPHPAVIMNAEEPTPLKPERLISSTPVEPKAAPVTCKACGWSGPVLELIQKMTGNLCPQCAYDLGAGRPLNPAAAPAKPSCTVCGGTGKVLWEAGEEAPCPVINCPSHAPAAPLPKPEEPALAKTADCPKCGEAMKRWPFTQPKSVRCPTCGHDFTWPAKPEEPGRSRHRVGYASMGSGCFWCTAGPGEACRDEPDKRAAKPCPSWCGQPSEEGTLATYQAGNRDYCSPWCRKRAAKPEEPR